MPEASARELVEALDPAVREVEQGRCLGDVDPSGVPSRASNSSSASASAWGRQWKIPPPSLSMTTIRTGVETSRSAARPPRSCRRPRSPVTIVVGRPLAWAAPMPEEIEAVDAVGAAVAEEEDVRLAGRQVGLLVADRHARGGVDEVAVAVGGAEGAVQAGLGELGVGRQLRLDRTRAPPARRRARSPGRRAPRLRAAPPSPPPARSGRRAAAPPPAGSARSSRRTGRRRSGRRRRRQPGAQRLAGRHLAEAQDEVGRDRLGEPLVAQQQVVGGDDVGAVVGPAAQLRGRLGEDREAGGAGEVGERLAQLGVELAPGDDHARVRRRRCAWRPRRAGTRRAPGRSA